LTRFAIRGLLGRKLRAALTAIAIVLGVAMICGTYVLTDSISQAFDAIFETTYRNTDAVVTGKRAFSGSANGNALNPSFDETLLPKVQALPDVRAALGGVQGDAHLIGSNGKVIVFGGAPNIGFSVDPTKPEFNSLTLVQGTWPGGNQLVVDQSTASKKNLAVGQTIRVQSRGPIVKMTISGIAKYGAVSSIGGATLAGFDLRTAQRLFDKEGQLDQIRIAAKSGVSPGRLVAEVRTILPPGTQVRSGTAQASADAKDTADFLSFLQKFLLAFGGVALFVGAFVIANSLSITIAQRTREFATLRTIGASRRQVLTSVIVEALALGILASVAGLFLGLALAKGLFRLFDAVGFTLPNNGLTFENRTIVVSLLVGIVVTLVASLRPAFRATRVPPVAAVREGATLPPGRFHYLRPYASAAVALFGFALLAYGLFGHGLGTTKVLLLMLFGALLVFIGVALFAPQLVRPLAHALGWPATRIGGAAGGLARSNAQRNPQRTASTAAALMIGLALVTLVATLAAGIIKPFTDAVNQLFVADYAITAQNNFDPIPPAAAIAAAKVPGVDAIASVRGGDAVIVHGGSSGDVIQVTGVEPQTSKVINLKWQSGSPTTIDHLGANGAVISKAYAKDHGLAVGSPIVIVTPTGERLDLVVKGVFAPPTGGSPFGTVTISSQTFDRHWQQPLNLFTFLKMTGGVTDANTTALQDALKAFPNAKAQTRQQFKDNQINGFKQVLNILYVLLALSVLVSFFGIVNTLVLTVFERTRELGMLRAIGMTRRQVRRMIRHESIITALIGAALGIVLGLTLGGLLAYRVKEIVFAVPWQQLVIFTIAAIIVGILAAIFPARRAAKLDPLQAIAYE
jgi:putative ABC transport system permease protein